MSRAQQLYWRRPEEVALHLKNPKLFVFLTFSHNLHFKIRKEAKQAARTPAAAVAQLSVCRGGKERSQCTSKRLLPAQLAREPPPICYQDRIYQTDRVDLLGEP